MTEPSFHVHSIDWNREKTGRFWNWWSMRAERTSYFSRQAGEAVLAFVEERLALSSTRVLDYGCGTGHFTRKLLDRGARTQAVDFSTDSVAQTRVRVGNDPCFDGAVVADGLPLPLPDAGFDVVFALEVIEHLLPADRDPTLAELARLTRLGGHVIITTPNQEDLAAGEQMCPECGCVFHRMQHVSSWSARSLSETMLRHGFATVETRSLLFKPYARWPRVQDLIATLRGLAKPNLLYIGRRT